MAAKKAVSNDLRGAVECLINRLEQFRDIVTRYEKCAYNHGAMVTIASVLLWL